ncbi:MAG: ribonuclease P protein component [Actinomycetota bacterium]
MQELGSLARSIDFSRVLREGCRSSLPGVSISTSPAAEGIRLGLAVRASGAVQRNRVKRRLREAFRVAARTSGTGVDVVIRADGRAAMIPFQELEALARRAVSLGPELR